MLDERAKEQEFDSQVIGGSALNSSALNNSEGPSKSVTEGETYQLAIIQRLSFTDAIFDLDQTLVRTREFHIGLFRIACDRFGIDNEQFEAQLVPVYNNNRGAAYSLIIENVFDAAERIHPEGKKWAPHERRQALYEASEEVLLDPRHPLRDFVTVIPGAPEIYRHVHQLGLSTRICTGSPRRIASTLLEIAGYHVEPHHLVCHGDLDFDKHDGAYWDQVLQSVDRQRCIGFDDTPQGAEWLLEVAGLRLVCVVPSSPDFAGRMNSIKERHPDRLILANEWASFLRPKSS